ncbi:MAG: amidohydrolase family protein [Acidobacteria bacterium]|nr:amidohydrolase family protein [Acidobacteriota bacterium]
MKTSIARTICFFLALTLFYPLCFAQTKVLISRKESHQAKPEDVLVKNATIWTMGQQGVLQQTDLLIKNGKIVQIGKNISAPSSAVVIDATGKHVTPGLIDCHSHTAARGGLNEAVNNISPEVRINDVLDPEDTDIYRQLAGGLTAANVLHGSANAIGGQNAVVKLKWRSSREEMLVAGAPEGVKFALGENPKRSNFNLPGVERRYPNTRMGVEQLIRERFLSARNYLKEWDDYNKLSDSERSRHEPPRKDLQLEAIGEILQGKRLVHSHCYRQDEILALIRLAEEFGFRITTFQHVLEGYKVADEMAQHGVGGSTFSDWWAFKLEAYDAIPYNGTIMANRGVVVSFNSDSGELARRMNLEAAKAVKYGGLNEVEALKFVTINPAKQLKIDNKVGSLETGKDADFVIWSGHPLSVYSIAEQTWVEGFKEFDRQADIAERDTIEQERKKLIDKIKAEDKKPKQDKDKPTDESKKPETKTEGSEKADKAKPEDKPKEEKAKEAKTQPAKPKREIPPAQAVSYLDRLSKTSQSFAIVGATIHPVNGAEIPNGTVVCEQGKIKAIGAKVAVPRGAKVIDGKGKHVYPGLISANTSLGLTEIGSVNGSLDLAETGSVNTNVNTAIAVNPDSELIPVARANGITHVLTRPEGGLISGTSALIRLDGWTWEDLRAGSHIALHIQWPAPPQTLVSVTDPTILSRQEEQKKAYERNLKTINQALEDARAYQLAKNAAGKPGTKPLNADPTLEAMLPVLEGKIPVIIHAEQLTQIKNAIKWTEEEGLRMILASSGDVWRIADLLKEKQIAVIVTGVLNTPARDDESYDSAYAVASKLHAKGVKFCIANPGGNFDAAFTRNLPYHSAMAAAFGLPKEEALKAVTLYPAEILGLGTVLGSIEVGKSASLILTDGDPLEIRTKILAEYIDGRPVNLNNNKHYKLYEKYNNRPKF